jgi:hypothetical protein
MALTPISLRVEDPDGRTVAEYRIHDEAVEVRHLPLLADAEDEWYQLTPEDLTSHVSRNTPVAQWLTRRLGWRRLLRACLNERELYLDRLDSPVERRAA